MTAAVLSTGFVGVGVADNPSTLGAQSTNDSGDTADGDTVIENFTERIETLETVEFTRTTESELGGDTQTTSQRLVADLVNNQVRTETLESATGNNVTTVINETHLVTYNADENTVSKTERLGGDNSFLPQVTQLANESMVSYEYAGTDTVAGEEVYLLDVTPQQAQTDSNNMSITASIDTETYFPVRIETDIQTEQYNISSTQTYENITLNEEIPESTFELDIPEDATQPSLDGPDIANYDEYSALQSNTDLSLPPAELTDGYEFDSARTLDGDGYHTVSMTYTNGTETVRMSAQNKSVIDWSESDNHEAVDINDKTGYYAEYDKFGYLRVGVDDSYYVIHGSHDKDQLIDIAASTIDS